MIAELTDRRVLAINGTDAVPFLNGLISQDVTKVTVEQPLYGCLLTPQGKYVADFFIVLDGEQILLDIHAARADVVLNRLRMFVLRSKAMLSDVSGDYRVYAAWGDDAALPGGYTDPRVAAMGQRVLTRDDVETNASLDDYHNQRIKNGVPDVGDFEIERTALLEANLDLLHGIAWDKGCYMGQELTARTHYRGLVKKRLLPFAFRGDAPAYDSELRLGDQVIGHVRSVATGVGMALMKVEFMAAAWDGNVTVNGALVTVMKPGWFNL